jgi:hypothetical protein
MPAGSTHGTTARDTSSKAASRPFSSTVRTTSPRFFATSCSIPVRANIVERPEDYRWSSYHGTAGQEAPDWFDLAAALAPFGGADAAARANYRAFITDGITSSERLWDKVISGMYLGSDPWVKKMRAIVESQPRSTDHPRFERAVGRPAMPRIIAAVAETAHVSPSTLRATRGGYLRALAAWLGWNEGLLTLRSIAASLRVRSEGHISNIIRRCEAAFAENAELLATMDRAMVSLRA